MREEAEAGPETLTAASRRARGRYPTDVLAKGGPFAPEDERYHVAEYKPELHQLDSEWYFTKHSSQLLAQKLSGHRACLLGTPTVANLMSGDSFTLVDRSPFLIERFPALNVGNWLRCSVEGVSGLAGFDACLLDPPWYFPTIQNWLNIAIRAVLPQGRIMLPLLGEGTRPTAQQERRAILSALNEVGRVEVHRNVLEYDIPLFEMRALDATDIRPSRPWRLADLVVVVLEGASNDLQIDWPAASHRYTEQNTVEWDEICIGSQVVAISSAPSSGETLMQPVPGTVDWMLDSVSRRDPRIRCANAWTSRNRIAVIGDRDRFVGALNLIARLTSEPSRILTELGRSGLSEFEIQNLQEFLEWSDHG